MKFFFTIIAIGLLVYAITWSAAYLVAMGFDLKYYLEYLRLSWTNPGEIPAFIQMTSLIITGVTMVIAFLWLRR